MNGPTTLLGTLLGKGMRRLLVGLVGGAALVTLTAAGLLYLLAAIRAALVPYLNWAGASAATGAVAVGLVALVLALVGRSIRSSRREVSGTALPPGIDQLLARLEDETRSHPLSTTLIAILAGMMVGSQPNASRWFSDLLRPRR